MSELHIFCTDGTRVLPAAGVSVCVSLDNSAMELLTKPHRYLSEATALTTREYLRGLAPEKLEIVANVATIEHLLLKGRPFCSFPSFQQRKLRELTGKRYSVPSVEHFAYIASQVVCRVLCYSISLLFAQTCFLEVGSAPRLAESRIRTFGEIARNRPGLGAKTVVALAIYEALGHNTPVRKSLRIGKTKVALSELLNSAFDLYQFEFMLASGTMSRRPDALGVYFTRDANLAQAFAFFRNDPDMPGLVTVHGRTLQDDAVLGPLVRSLITDSEFIASDCKSLIRLMREGVDTLAQFVSPASEDFRTLQRLRKRVSELSGFLRQASIQSVEGAHNYEAVIQSRFTRAAQTRRCG